MLPMSELAAAPHDLSQHNEVNVLVAACQVEVHRLVWFVGILAFTIAMILFVIGLARKMDPLNAFVNGFILVVVANVPEVRPLPCGGSV